MKKLYVGNLSYSTVEPTISSLFEKYGPILSCSLIKDKFTGNSKGFAFVEIENDTMALDAIKELDGSSLDGNSIKVNEARPREDSGNGGPRGRSGGGGGGFRR